ncbi:alanine/glycine:cation symporter family protein [Schwartzia succinivorans]|jgi:AGCS family alanine or glycine:cation symporter|uniref:Alanine or glycine:cation symporter, AGCS family n=1 Tax=Schwartzia succinivorans DSM 10502 TaxID=1123243 RepID=A0A1M4XJ97_9FIRM|nr:sodium:alanine symporter family protein [Schwartzia succinivorans]SHE93624.1 alanine or glycine:cation symporter, AGCS family [Schwartzia succinivorans DSM 10502]
MEELNSVLTQIDDILWGVPLIVLLLGTGIYLTIRLNLLQVFRLPLALKLIFKAQNDGKGDVSSFKALCVALAATVGTGNIVGVATAVKLGGPGAVFWMWVAAFFGMATKYAEGLLAVKYRSVDAKGEIAGGPMFYIKNGMGEKWAPMAAFFAFACILVAFFGIGTFPQVNAIVDSMKIAFGLPVWVTDAIITILVAAITIGGLKNIARVAGKIVPFMAVIYVVVSIGLILMNLNAVPDALALIVRSAFTGEAAAGGFAGSTIMMAMQKGIARGIFSNESGLGSAPIAAAAAKTKWPAEQGLISMTGTFIDTIIICSMTGLALVLTGVWKGTAAGAMMTTNAFASAYGHMGVILLTVSLALFAFTTILGWNYYGERACIYLFGTKGVMPYRLIFIALVASGAYLKLDAIWTLADIVNGLMAIPNLIALIALAGVIVSETKRYLEHLESGEKD